MPLMPDMIVRAGQDLLACACSSLVASHRMGEDCCDPDGNDYRSYLLPGDPAVEVCGCSCGELAVRFVRMFESEQPPIPITGPSPCGNRTAVGEFQVIRWTCVNEKGTVQAPAVITANATKLWTDLWVLWTGLGCCMRAWAADPTDTRQGWIVDAQPVEPQGGCAGAMVTVQMQVGPSCDCRPFTPEPIA